MSNLQGELSTNKKELDRQQSERVRIAYVFPPIIIYPLLKTATFSANHSPRSKLEAEADEKLQLIYHQLLQAGVDRNENEREVKMRETLASLQELFPGMYCVSPSPCMDKLLNGYMIQVLGEGWWTSASRQRRNTRWPSLWC